MQEDSWFGIPQGMPDPMVGPRRCRSSSQLPDPLPLRAARARRRGSSGTQSPVSAPLHPPPGRAAGTRRGVPLAQRLAAAAALDRPPPPHLDVLAALCEESTVVLPSLATDAPLASLGATCEDSPLAADGAALPPSKQAPVSFAASYGEPSRLQSLAAACDELQQEDSAPLVATTPTRPPSPLRCTRPASLHSGVSALSPAESVPAAPAPAPQPPGFMTQLVTPAGADGLRAWSADGPPSVRIPPRVSASTVLTHGRC